MPRSRLEISPGLWLDARHAIWLAEERVLAVADLHLGYAWAHRQSGNLLPLCASDDTADRLEALVANYQPAKLVLLGDIVHRAIPIPSLRETICDLFMRFNDRTSVHVLLGNHDEGLQKLFSACDIKVECMATCRVGIHLLIHGDRDLTAAHLDTPSDAGETARAKIIMGHEHPAISVGDGVTSRVRCPCFLVSQTVIILPAFSAWAAGSDIRNGTLMSPIAQNVIFETAVAVMNGKLLPISLTR